MSDFQLFSAKSKRMKAEQEDENVLENVEEIQGKVTVKKSAEDFASLGLLPFICESLESLAIYKPTPVQAACIPEIIQGKHVIASSKTGTGKTLAFTLPIIHKLSEDPYGIYALILTPTRDLAYQIAEQVKVVGEGMALRMAVIVGGVDMVEQSLQLKKRPHVVIATPGRFADHIKSNPDVMFLKRLKFLVFDEADRLLEDSFADHLEYILDHLPPQKQTLLFSATMTEQIEQLKKPNTFVFKLPDGVAVEKLDQRYVLTPSLVRNSYLVWLLKNRVKDKSVIIFANKCRTAELLRVLLHRMEFSVTSLHSQMSQQHRIANLSRFRSGQVSMLVSTDVGSRGLDIPAVDFVINYDLPNCCTDYIHRIGRTARAGRSGTSISCVTEMDVDIVMNIESAIGKKLEPEEVKDNEINDMIISIAEVEREANMFLVDSKFGEKRRINKLKRKVE